MMPLPESKNKEAEDKAMKENNQMGEAQEFSVSDADDDFDDRYIHLSKIKLYNFFSCGSFRNK